MAGSAAGALLETLVHLEVDREDMPSNYQLLRVYLDADVSEQDCGELPVGWREDVGLTRQIGDTWLRVCDSLLLRVPSAIAPGTFNYLFNPLHEEAYDAEVPPFDIRLLPRQHKNSSTWRGHADHPPQDAEHASNYAPEAPLDNLSGDGDAWPPGGRESPRLKVTWARHRKPAQASAGHSSPPAAVRFPLRTG